jgi:hypothetical protein
VLRDARRAEDGVAVAVLRAIIQARKSAIDHLLARVEAIIVLETRGV